MDTKAKCILVMVAMCILITPAFSQGGERDGRNGNPGSNMGPTQDNTRENKLGPQGAPNDEPAHWSHIEPGDGQHNGVAFGFAGSDEQVPPRSIMGRDHQRDTPKKSLMEKKHHRNFPELPPMKSIMDHRR